MHRPGVELAISRSQVRRHNHYTTEPDAKCQNFVTVLFFGINIPTTKREIMLHAMWLNLPTLLTAFIAYVCISVTSLFYELDQRVIDTAVRQRRTRLRACVKAKDGHFEQKLSQ